MSEKRKLWYTRVDNKMRGPFPGASIHALILLGRLRETDEVSEDQIVWHQIKQLPELIPEEMKADLSLAHNREKLRLARMRVDDREQEDRRIRDSDETEIDTRRGSERRAEETPEELALRRARVERKLREQERRPENYTVRFSILICFIASILWIAFTTTSDPIVAQSACNMRAKPTIVWDNCKLDGIQLPGENLASASMVNASLVGADLRQAKLPKADLSYANLSNARLDGASFSTARLKGGNLRQASLVAASLEGSNLEFAIMHGADLSNASFRNANLTHVDLSAANLKNADFTGAILDKAIWSDNTVCSPESVGHCMPLR